MNILSTQGGYFYEGRLLSSLLCVCGPFALGFSLARCHRGGWAVTADELSNTLEVLWLSSHQPLVPIWIFQLLQFTFYHHLLYVSLLQTTSFLLWNEAVYKSTSDNCALGHCSLTVSFWCMWISKMRPASQVLVDELLNTWLTRNNVKTVYWTRNPKISVWFLTLSLFTLNFPFSFVVSPYWGGVGHNKKSKGIFHKKSPKTTFLATLYCQGQTFF